MEVYLCQAHRTKSFQIQKLFGVGRVRKILVENIKWSDALSLLSVGREVNLKKRKKKGKVGERLFWWVSQNNFDIWFSEIQISVTFCLTKPEKVLNTGFKGSVKLGAIDLRLDLRNDVKFTYFVNLIFFSCFLSCSPDWRLIISL